jgi:hypothetical protein
MSCFFEGVSLYRAERAPGTELIEIESCSRVWWGFSMGVELIVPETFCASMWYRRRLYRLVPGQIFCVAPDEIIKVAHVQRAGALKILALDRELLARCEGWNELGRRTSGPLPTITHAIALRAAMDCVLQALRLRHPIDLSAAVSALFGAIRETPCVCAAAVEMDGDVGAPCSCRSRELTSRPSESGPRWARADLSLFQAHRRFKHRHGLPPHAYQLCVRIAQAKQLLRSGSSPSSVAATQGFADQSHFARHFKRLVGVTPHEYACAGVTRLRRRSTRSGG